MKNLALVCVVSLALAACHNNRVSETSSVSSTDSQVVVSKTVDINGVKVQSSLALTQFAMRAALGNNPNTAAYVTIQNAGKSDDRLVSAACACATTTSLHTMKMTGTTMEMAEVKDGFTIKPGETITFAPGGNHIMLENLTQRPQAGQTVDLILTFEKAGPVTLHLPVSNTPLARTGTSGGMDHGDMKM